MLLKILMYKLRCKATNPKHCHKKICAWSKMRNGTQILNAMSFLLQRIAWIRHTNKAYLACFKLKRLLHIRCEHYLPLNLNGRAYCKFHCLVKVFGNSIFTHYLKVLKKATVIQLNKAIFLAIAYSSHPCTYFYV